MSLRGLERKEFAASVRRAAFKRCCQREGIPRCETCRTILRAGNIIFEHEQPAGLGGESTLDNCKVHCRNCADIKTFTEDNPRMAKADAVLKKTYGLKPTRQKIQSRGFAKSAPQRTASRPIERRT